MKQALKSRIDSFRYAFKGIKTLFETQVNAWIHMSIMIIVIIAGIVLNCSSTEWAILCLCFGSVLAAEAFNTAIEFLTDLVSPAYHELAGKTKDVAAAAVLITAFAAIGVACFIFLPKILKLIS